MNTNQYTQKTLEALQAAQQLAVEYQHNALEPEHLLHALASQEQGLIPQLLQKLNVDPGSFAAAVAEKLSALPRVSGSGRDPDKVYISQATDKVLSAAAREAKAMKDEYVSVEHVFLGLLDEPTQNTTELFRAFGIAKDKFLQQLTAVRGNQRVTTDNPEDTYNALQKYGQDLVDLARKQKLDPVIGRDQEIRNVIRILSRKTKNNPCLIGEPGVGKTILDDFLCLLINYLYCHAVSLLMDAEHCLRLVSQRALVDIDRAAKPPNVSPCWKNNTAIPATRPVPARASVPCPVLCESIRVT